MKLKQTVAFNLRNLKKPVIIFYIIVFTSFSLVALWNNLSTDNSYITFGGLELTTCITLFVFGLSLFRSELFICLQNGISRKTALLGYLISSSIMAVIMGFIDAVFYSTFNGNGFSSSLFIQLYAQLDYNKLSLLFVSFAWNVFLYLCLTLFGYFLAVLYYRMNKSLKLIVSIGVPIFIIVVLPILDELVVNYAIRDFLKRFIRIMVGTYGGSIQPWNWMLSNLFLSILFTFFSYLLIRRADIKSK